MNSNTILSYWNAPTYLPYLQPDLTEAAIKEGEKVLGVTLPKKYIELLKIQNGGYIRYTLEGVPHETTYGIGPYFPNLTDLDWSDYLDYVSFELNGLIPFDGDGHWFLCFDYRRNTIEPQITYIDTEIDKEQIVANSFGDYLSKLIVDTEDKWVIETNNKIEIVIKQLEEILKIKFDDPDTWAHGYPIYRSALNEEWIWISPTNVSKDFVRTDDERYEQLVKKTEGFSLRYPELGEKYLIISFSEEEIAKEIIEDLKSNSVAIRPMSEYFDK